MMINCPVCGAPLKNRYCDYCGYIVEEGSDGRRNNSQGQTAQQRRSLEDLDREVRAEHAYSQQNSFEKQQAWSAAPQPVYVYRETESHYSRAAVFLLCFFLGIFGVHRFYVRKIGTGLLWLMTFGLFGLGWLVDVIMIATGTFTDNKGLPVKS